MCGHYSIWPVLSIVNQIKYLIKRANLNDVLDVDDDDVNEVLGEEA